ncbi:PHB depolymerase family esterase [Variovorax guangxiensis]|uniref:PHB depolymerase family esterase n=1 Tax=Variovorax guangxiensis TaxID=1775474 RepID=UPI00286D0C98|nr:PHB depolymerase family esterase [Variovorax guangxiensis]
MNTLTREHGMLVLYPEQTQHANAQKCWNWFKPQHQHRGRGEPAVLAALTQSVTAKLNVDAARGRTVAEGAMADIVRLCHPDIFAAVGVHSGLPSGDASDVMSALSVMRSGGATSHRGDADVPPVIVFHSDADHTVHTSNGDAIVEFARRGAGGPSQACRASASSSSRFPAPALPHPPDRCRGCRRTS